VVDGTDELIFGGRNIMMGYLKGEQQTKETIDDDGWLHSGDCGKIDEDGFMTITGRIKELIITAGGENVPPVIIEDTIKEELPLLSNVMVIGDRRKFLSALFTLRVTVDKEGHPTDTLDEKALSIMKEIGSSATTVAEARADEKVTAYLDAGLKRANGRATSRAQNVGKYTVLDHDFSINGNELTPTLKLKRKIVYEKYESVIEGLYA
jgi:long-chain-fatty-acid--CoA ligase ACSBG